MKKSREPLYRVFQKMNNKIDIFMGMMESQVKCLSCGHISSMFEPFYEWTLHIKTQKFTKTSLMSCLQYAVKEEQLDGRIDCDGCKQKQIKTKRIAMAKIPETLVIQLSRFDHQSSFNVRKDKTPVEFPQLLTDIEFLLSDVRLKYADEPEQLKYQLRGFCAHSGTLQFGHYVAYVKEKDWTYRSDSEISPVNFGPVLNRDDAYLLFYERIY
jgi:ubiquitin C-terminal hydrolase